MLEEAKKELESGNVISYPTETVYGLGVDPRNEIAVEKLLKIKQRNSSISLIADSIETVNSLPIVETTSELRLKLQDKHWPGALTLIVKLDIAKVNFSKKLLAKDQTIAIRVSSSDLARNLAGIAGGLITATSANPKDLKPAKNKQESLDYFPKIYALKSEVNSQDMPSTIYSLVENKILRQGSINI